MFSAMFSAGPPPPKNLKSKKKKKKKKRLSDFGPPSLRIPGHAPDVGILILVLESRLRPYNI